MTVHIEDVLLEAAAYVGKLYRLGAEVDPSTPPDEIDSLDCSELIEAVCARAGVTPTMPDGTGNQLAHSNRHGTIIPVDEGLSTRGALLHRADPGRGLWGHVAISMGDGTTLEARGKRWGVGYFADARNRTWTHASRIPGVDYTPRRQIGDWVADVLDPVAGKQPNGRRAFWRVYNSGWIQPVNGARQVRHLGDVELIGKITAVHDVPGFAMSLTAEDGGTFDVLPV